MMAGGQKSYNIPPSIFSAVAQPFGGNQPSRSAADSWRLQVATSWPDRLSQGIDWQPTDSGLPVPSLPAEEPSFGLTSLPSRHSLGERVSLASKQMALSVLDILNTKPPGPPDDAAAPADAPPLRAGAPPARSPVTSFEINPLSLPAPGQLGQPLPSLQQHGLMGAARASLEAPPTTLRPLRTPAAADFGSAPAAAKALPPTPGFSFPSPPGSAFGPPPARRGDPPASPAAAPHAPPPAEGTLSRPPTGKTPRASERTPSSDIAWPEAKRRTTRAASAVVPSTAAPGVRADATAASTSQTTGTSQGSQEPSAEPSSAQPQVSSRRRSGRGVGSGGETSRRKASKKDDLRSKNREAQRRFREKQKAKLDQLEEKSNEVAEIRGRMEAQARDYEARLAAGEEELRRLQLERAALQLWESRAAEAAAQLGRPRGAGSTAGVDPPAADRPGCVDAPAAQAGCLSAGGVPPPSKQHASALAKVAACLKAEDFADGREALRSVERVDSLCIRLHALAPIAGSGGEAAVPDQAGPDNEEGACITIGELLKLPHESLQALYAACVDALVPLVQQCPNANPVVQDPKAPFGTPAEQQIRSLVREVRAVMACFGATDAREAVMQQLRGALEGGGVDNADTQAACNAIWRALNLTENQAAALAEAYARFQARQRALAQQRAAALPVLADALHAAAPGLPAEGHLRRLEADDVVRKSIKEEYDNIAKLSGYFGNVVLTDWQAAVLHARASPCRAHIMGVIEAAVSEGAQPKAPEQSRQGMQASKPEH